MYQALSDMSWDVVTLMGLCTRMYCVCCLLIMLIDKYRIGKTI